MNIVSAKEKEDYIKNNHLEDSFLPFNILYMCRGTMPERIEIGRIENFKIFFEEGISSFKRRHYKLQKDVTSWNLVVSNGKTTSLLSIADKEWLLKNKEQIKMNQDNNYTIDFLVNFLETKTKKINPLNPIPAEKKKIRYQKWLTQKEIEYVNKFIDELRKTEAK